MLAAMRTIWNIILVAGWMTFFFQNVFPEQASTAHASIKRMMSQERSLKDLLSPLGGDNTERAHM